MTVVHASSIVDHSAPALPPDLARGMMWLEADPAVEPVDDLAALNTHLAILDQTGIHSEQFHRTLNLFFSRAQKLTTQLKPQLLDVNLPLTPELRRVTQSLTDIFHFLASGYQRILRDIEDRQTPVQGKIPLDITQNAMECVAQQMEIAALIAAPVQPGLWRTANGLFIRIRHEDAGGSSHAAQTYRTLLALTAALPESLSAQQVAATLAYLSRFGRTVEILDHPPAAADAGLFWLDPSRDISPKAVARSPIPPGRAELLYISYTKLAALAAQQIKALEQGMSLTTLKLPPQAAEPAFFNLLQELRQKWGEPEKRHFPRRRSNYRTHACVGLDGVWRLLREGSAEGSDTRIATEWMVMNESPIGYTLMHMSGHLQGLRHGAVIALQTQELHWQICVVRWLSSENPEHMELGLQILAPGAQPVIIAFESETGRQPSVRGLLLDPLPTLRPHPVILAPAGCSSAHGFVLVSGVESTQVSLGHRVSLDMQTACIELFQYEPDFSPL